METTITPSRAQESNSNEWLIPREEFELIDDPNSLEEIVIYDVVVEYQGIITSNTRAEEDVIEVKTKPTEKYPSKTVLGNTPQTLMNESNNEILESTTMSQAVIAHEEEVRAQSFGEPSDEELEEWTKILNNKADDEQ